MKSAFWLVAVTFVLGVARYVPIWDEPWGRDLASGNGVWYSGQPVRNWQRLGFENLRGMSLLGALPTSPPTGVPYTHHPPLFNWTIYAVVQELGFSERSFRLLPILLSAAAGALIALLACETMGTAAAAVAALMWLVLPMSFLYGIMCNPEVPTLFLIVLTVWLHGKLRLAPWPFYSAVVVVHFLAAQMDWEGHFTVPALFLYELLTPREGWKLGKVLALGCTSLLSAAVVFIVHGYYLELGAASAELLAAGVRDLPRFSPGSIPTYLTEGLHGALRTASASVGEGELGTSDWLLRQGQHATQMFTWPAILAVVAGVVIVPFRRTDGLAFGVSLLVPGILNVAIFRAHAAGHEYWLYYLTPGVVLITADVLRRLSNPRMVILGLVGIVAFSLHRVEQRLSAGRTAEFRDLAGELDRFLGPGDPILVCDVRLCPVTFYTRHWVVAEPSAARAWEHVVHLAWLKSTKRLINPLLFFLMPSGELPPIQDLSKYGPIEVLDPPEVAQRFPTISRSYGGAIWILKID